MKKTKRKPRKSIHKGIDAEVSDLALYGREPENDFSSDPEEFNREYGFALSWFSAHTKASEQKDAFIRFFLAVDFPESDVNQLNKLPDWQFSTYGAFCVMLNKGFPAPQKYTDRLINKYQELLVEARKIPDETGNVVVYPANPDPLLNQILTFFNQTFEQYMEGEIDEITLPLRDTVTLLEGKKQTAQAVYSDFIGLDHDLMQAQNGDEEFVEAYSFLTEDQMSHLRKTIAGFREEVSKPWRTRK